MGHRLRVVLVLVVVVGGDVFVSAVAGGGGGGGRGRMADTVVGRGAVSGVVSCGAERWGRVGSARRCPCVLFPVCIIIIMRVSRCLVFFCVFPFALWGGVLIVGRR